MKNHQPRQIGTLVVTTLAIVFLGIENEAAWGFTITSNPNNSNLLNAILGETTGLSNFEISVSGNPMAFGLFQDDPFGFSSGIVLSTGKVEDLPGLNTFDGTKRDANGVPQRDLSTNFDERCISLVEPFLCQSTTVDISFDVERDIEKIFFNYIFGSEEFVEFGGREFNDSFAVLLNGQNLAKLSDGKTVSINNLVPNFLDSTSFHPDYINNPVGSQMPTKLDGYTQVLGFEGILDPDDRNTLSIQITDVRDNWFDSAVFVQGGTFGTRPTPIKTVPEPSLWLGCLFFGAIAYLGKSWKF